MFSWGSEACLFFAQPFIIMIGEKTGLQTTGRETHNHSMMEGVEGRPAAILEQCCYISLYMYVLTPKWMIIVYRHISKQKQGVYHMMTKQSSWNVSPRLQDGLTAVFNPVLLHWNGLLKASKSSHLWHYTDMSVTVFALDLMLNVKWRPSPLAWSYKWSDPG